MGPPRLLRINLLWVGLSYLAGYVLLDWVSFIHPFAPFGVTPWNPPTGLSFILVVLFGQRFIWLLFPAPLLADLLVRQLPLPWIIELLSALVIGGGYATGLMFLLRPGTRFSPTLPAVRDLALLLATAAMSSALVAAGYGGTLAAAGLLPVRDIVPAIVQFWVGDVIGIAVVAPVGLLFLTRGFTGSREMLAQGIVIAGALVLLFSRPDQDQFQFFYILFLPIVWMAVRGGLEAVSLGILLTQIGLIIGIQLASRQNIDVTAFQVLMLVLTLTGLIAGAVVTENRRADMQLRLHQEALARMARVGSVGELAAAIAHEVNQPLMAAGTYTRLLLETLRSGGRHEEAVETATKAAGQVERAAEVIRKLRALFRLDRASKAPTDVRRIVTETLELFGPEMTRHAIAVRAEIDENISLVMVDMLQIEQVLLNLLRNSSEAISETGASRGVIVIKASHRDRNQVEFAVADLGPGFPDEILSRTPAVFQSAKPEGLGIGLSLCKTIVEAHGGKLTIVTGPAGGLVHFTVPAASSVE